MEAVQHQVVARVDHGGDGRRGPSLHEATEETGSANPSGQRQQHGDRIGVVTIHPEGHPGSEPSALAAAWPAEHRATGVLCQHVPGEAPELVDASGDQGRRFAWASLSKLCTALAFAVALEERTVGLDDPLGPVGSTVAHLLSHASGLGPDGSVLAPPARRRIYSNEGFELLALHLADRAGMPYTRYLADGVLGPLGMAGVEVPEVGAASHALRGTLRDLLVLCNEFLRPTLVLGDTLARATTVAFAGLDGVLPGFGVQRPCDWGLGFELRDGKAPHYTGAANSAATFGHFGQAGGMCWVDPVARVAVAVLTDRPFGPWAVEAWPAYSDAVLRLWRPPVTSAPP
jgi:CubicO group peptidase (beta-lactamase class C family)